MLKINKSFTNFLEALEKNQSIVCNNQGKWRVRSKIEVLVRKIFIRKDDDSILKAYLKIMEKAESKRLYFAADSKILDKQTDYYHKVLAGAAKIVQLNARHNSGNDSLKNLVSKIEMASIQLKYLISSQNGGLDLISKDSIDRDLFDELNQKVTEWKAQDEKYQYTQNIDFSSKIEQMCQYKELMRFLLKSSNKNLLHAYFKSALRDNVSVQLLSEYHFESDNLNKNFLAKRVFSLSNKDILTVDFENAEKGAQVKVLNLLMDGIKVNILNKKNTFEFTNGLKLKISEIYKDFENKNDDPGLLEVFYDGVKAFNSHKLVPLLTKKSSKTDSNVSIDTTKPNWYEDLPTLDIRSKEYIEKRYDVQVDPGEWVAVLEASRQKELDIDEAHGYSLFYQPIGDGEYRVYAFGAFPNSFPQTTLELINFVGKTVPGTIAHDPNYYYSQRQKASHAYIVPENIGRALLDEIGQRKNAGIAFQLGWENCAFTIRNIFSKVFKSQNYNVDVPQFFKKKFKHSKPDGALKIVKSMLSSSSEKLFTLSKIIIGLIFGAARSYKAIEDGQVVNKSLWNTPFFEDATINLPSAMHYRIKKDRKRKEEDPDYVEKYSHCVLNYGHEPT